MSVSIGIRGKPEGSNPGARSVGARDVTGNPRQWCSQVLQLLRDARKLRHARFQNLIIFVDMFVSATAMCQACGKLVNNYLRNKTTKEFLSALEADIRIRITELLQGKRAECGLSKEHGAR